MDLAKIAQEQLGQILGATQGGSNKTKKNSRKNKSAQNDVVDDIVGAVDNAVKSKLPKGTATDIAENALDQNKDGRIVDDIVRMGGSLLKRKK